MPDDNKPITEKEAAQRISAIAARFQKAPPAATGQRTTAQVGGLVGAVMKRYGFTEEQAIKAIEDFGG